MSVTETGKKYQITLYDHVNEHVSHLEPDTVRAEIFEVVVGAIAWQKYGISSAGGGKLSQYAGLFYISRKCFYGNRISINMPKLWGMVSHALLYRRPENGVPSAYLLRPTHRSPEYQYPKKVGVIDASEELSHLWLKGAVVVNRWCNFKIRMLPKGSDGGYWPRDHNPGSQYWYSISAGKSETR